MRTTILFALVAAAVATACDSNQTTAPRSIGATPSDRVAPQVQSNSGPVTQSRPQDQVGFTKITSVGSANSIIQPGTVVGLTADCPAGTTVVGGGYRMLGYVAGATPPWITRSGDSGTNGWIIRIDNEQPGANVVNIFAIAYCLS